MATKKILVTGGCGFVGRHMVKRLTQMGHNVTVVDNLSTGLKLDDWPEHLKCNPKDVVYSDCIEFFQNSRETYDEIFHFAAIVEGRLTIDNEPLKVAKDLMIDAAMFQWASRTKPKKIVYASSSAVYPVSLQSEHNHVPLSEDSVHIPEHRIGMPDMSYGWAKMTGEFLSHMAVAKHALNVAVYRPFSGYGEDQALSYPFPSIIKRVLESKGTVDVWGSGEQSRDFIYIEDCVSGILSTYESINDASALNLGTGVRTSFNQLIKKACNVMNIDAEIRPLLDKPVGVFARYADTKKQRQFNLVPKYSLEDGIRIVAEHLSE